MIVLLQVLVISLHGHEFLLMHRRFIDSSFIFFEVPSNASLPKVNELKLTQDVLALLQQLDLVGINTLALSFPFTTDFGGILLYVQCNVILCRHPLQSPDLISDVSNIGIALLVH